MIGGIIGGVIILLVLSLLALCLMRRRRRNQGIRSFVIASPDPFPHSVNPSPQAAPLQTPQATPPRAPQAAFHQPAPPIQPPRRMMVQTVSPTSMTPRRTFSDLGLPNMTEYPNDRAPSTVTRKQPVPFLNALDLGTEDQLGVRPVSPFSMNLSPGQDGRPVATEDPFADPARNPFEDPRPLGVPAVVVHPATPRQSAVSTSSDSKEVCRFSASTDGKIGY